MKQKAVLSLVLFHFSGLAGAADSRTCIAALRSLGLSSSRAESLLSHLPRLEERFANDELFRRVSVAVSKGGGRSVVGNDRLAIELTVERQGDSLNISIPAVITLGYSIGQRPPAADSQFPRLVAGILAGVRRRLSSEPDIRRITISGDEIYNPSLVRLLTELGFRERWGIGRLFPFLPVSRSLYLDLERSEP